MSAIETINDMHTKLPEGAEFSALYGLSMFMYNRIFYAVKMHVNFVEKSEGLPLTQWRDPKRKKGGYDSERQIVKKVSEFCEHQKAHHVFPKHEEFVKNLHKCCNARNALVHRIPEQARQIYFDKMLDKMQKAGEAIPNADYDRELIPMIREQFEVILAVYRQLEECARHFSSPTPTDKS